ncbi:hypothetical protein OROHE_022716 [Orobanche hederae]
MNKTSRLAAIINSQGNPFHLRACFFHCTPVSERRRRTHWDSATSFRSSPRKFNEYRKRLRKVSLFHNVSELAEHLFHVSDTNEYDQPSGRGSSWFRPSFREDGFKKGKSRNTTSRAFRRDFEFCDDDDDHDGEDEFETIFRSAFGGTRGFYFSFTMDDRPPRYRKSSSYAHSHRTSSGWKYQQYDEEYDSSSDSEKPTVDITSDRLALGLSSSGPLNPADVKNAYRACALKWHPDRHQGSSKVVAEQKFKVCSAAYQSLCDKLGLH